MLHTQQKQVFFFLFFSCSFSGLPLFLIKTPTDHTDRQTDRRPILITGKKVDLTIDLTTTTTTTHQLALSREKQVDRTKRFLDFLKV